MKEYGEDFFQLQEDAVKPGQLVLVVDDIIATGTFCIGLWSFGRVFSSSILIKSRWICPSSGRACRETRSNADGLPLHSRNRLSQRPR